MHENEILVNSPFIKAMGADGLIPYAWIRANLPPVDIVEIEDIPEAGLSLTDTIMVFSGKNGPMGKEARTFISESLAFGMKHKPGFQEQMEGIFK